MKRVADGQTLIDLCARRALEAQGDKLTLSGRDPTRRASKRETIKAMWVSTMSGQKVAALVVMWTVAREELGHDVKVEEFVGWSHESRATVHRRLQEFRRLFPEYETPNELAQRLAEVAAARNEKPNVLLPVVLAAVV